MKPRSFLSLPLIFSAALWVWIPLTYGQEEYHGADSVFETEDMIILWAILKGPDEEHSWVYIKILFPGAGPNPWQSFRVEAVDPFSREKEWVTPREKVEKENVVKTPRSSFRDKTGRSILFYRDQDAVDRPGRIVFYQGVPDTTPELGTEAQLEDYFNQALKRLKKP
jgi:hypothetical protein